MKIINLKLDKNYDVYIGRGSKWGNPYSHLKNSQAKFIVDSREESINAYIYYILIDNPKLFNDAKIELKNKVLSCYCKPLACHGDFLVEISNSEYDIDYYKKKYLNIL